MAADKLLGEEFGDLTVLSRVVRHKTYSKFYCKCVCGGVKEYFLSNLRKGKSSSCGCTRAAKVSAKLRVHGKEPVKLYETWTNMKTRCSNEKANSFEYYGAKGINVCEEWVDDFIAFRDWSLGNGFRDDLSIDRIDNSLGYSPSNCRWADNETQSRNRGVSWHVEIDGVTKHAMEWCVENGIPYKTAHTRKSRGWSEVDAVTMPVYSVHSYEIKEASE